MFHKGKRFDKFELKLSTSKREKKIRVATRGYVNTRVC